MRVWLRPMKWLGLLALVAALVAVVLALRSERADKALADKMGTVVPMMNGNEINCQSLAASHPLVLLVLGQSNAGNHGVARQPAPSLVPVFAEGRCALASDPLPGGTGRGGSIWTALPQALIDVGVFDRPLVLSVLAVDASSIVDWTRQGSPLRQALLARIGELARAGLAPTLVLWQQGESDARSGMPAATYLAHLLQLRKAMSQAGSDAPLLLAHSTICRSTVEAELRQAVTQAAMVDKGLRLGADTDTLSGLTDRVDRCHFTEQGQLKAAALWAKSIKAALGA